MKPARLLIVVALFLSCAPTPSFHGVLVIKNSSDESVFIESNLHTYNNYYQTSFVLPNGAMKEIACTKILESEDAICIEAFADNIDEGVLLVYSDEKKQKLLAKWSYNSPSIGNINFFDLRSYSRESAHDMRMNYTEYWYWFTLTKKDLNLQDVQN